MVGRRAFVAAALVAAYVGLGVHAQPADAAHNAAVVVIDTGASVRTATIQFHEPSISGLKALELAGANPVTRPYGPGLAVCRLDGVGHSQDNCLGTPSDPRYWAYFRAPAGSGTWAYSSVGAGASQVRHGDWEGWRFGTGAPPGIQPPSAAPPGGGGASPGSGGSGASGGSGGDGDPGGGPPGGGAGGEARRATRDGAAGGPSAPGADEPADATEVDGETTDAETTRGQRDGDALEAAPAATGSSGPDGSGSPLGLVVAALLAAGLVSAAIVIHRRRAAATPL